MKILVVSQYFYPENFRINKLVDDLLELGHQVDVLTGQPNYPQGEYYKGYNNNEIKEDYHGATIYRCKMRARKTGSKNLLMNYMSFAYNARKRIKKLKESYDVVYVFEVSPITVALPAISYKKKKGVPIIMNVQDLWPENVIAITKINNKLIISMIDKLVNYIYKHVDVILCSSLSFVENIKERVSDKDKVLFWPQYSVVQKAQTSEIKYDKNKVNIIFTGNIGEAQGLDIIIEPAKKYKDKVEWHILGDGRYKKDLMKKIEDQQLETCIKFYDSVEESLVPQYLMPATAALITLNDNPVFDMTLPAKLQTYMACGKLIFGCVRGECYEIVKESNAGIVNNKVNTQGMCEILEELVHLNEKEIEQYQLNSYEFSNKSFNKDKLLNELIKIMEDILCLKEKRY